MANNSKKYDNRGAKVKARRITEIRRLADHTRKVLNQDGPYIDVIRILEHQLQDIGINYDIRPTSELNGAHGITYPNEALIVLSDEVVEGASEGNGRDRFTIAHEIGHLLMHDNVSFARQSVAASHRVFEDSEWQADTFAAEFLMPVAFVRKLCGSTFDIIQTFGVSNKAAFYRWTKLEKEGLL
ncbi:ImmA/IrrE family metallo-endopeptidase [Thiohalomonas denitrificans]|uniref:ImmA/IrrE family metallo-endopeptidase n=1 Tax=Thiohalomonas denitrificans TaxID=415747 RepID=UPI0026F35267|nr:ImmA/IrrE family metallo-endopeptidase [Thiohalomonas denitrificans]